MLTPTQSTSHRTVLLGSAGTSGGGKKRESDVTETEHEGPAKRAKENIPLSSSGLPHEAAAGKGYDPKLDVVSLSSSLT
jgi:hypothetical protein